MSSEMQTRHISVMKKEVLDGIEASAGGDFLDCTLGGAGHSESILEANPENTVLGCDRDEKALERAQKRLARFGSRFSSAKASFSELSGICKGRRFDGLLADLGLSTDQLFEKRGFSFKDSDSLDMRMDLSSDLSADEVVNHYSEKDLLHVLKVGGLSLSQKSVVRAIIKARPIKSSSELAQIVSSVLSFKNSKKKVHPATVVFQAIRMEVNREVQELNSLFEQMPKLLKPKAKVVIISFHSGEDKIVARQFRKWAGSESAPVWWMGDRKNETAVLGTLAQNAAQTPSQEEVENNAASRSARLRVFRFN